LLAFRRRLECPRELRDTSSEISFLLDPPPSHVLLVRLFLSSPLARQAFDLAGWKDPSTLVRLLCGKKSPIISPDHESGSTFSKTQLSTLTQGESTGDRQQPDKPNANPSSRNRPESSQTETTSKKNWIPRATFTSSPVGPHEKRQIAFQWFDIRV